MNLLYFLPFLPFFPHPSLFYHIATTYSIQWRYTIFTFSNVLLIHSQLPLFSLPNIVLNFFPRSSGVVNFARTNLISWRICGREKSDVHVPSFSRIIGRMLSRWYYSIYIYSCMCIYNDVYLSTLSFKKKERELNPTCYHKRL